MTTSVRPQPGPSRSYHFPSFERRRLANGLSLVVAPVPKLPLVTVIAVVDAGATCDPAGREGAAQLTALALLEGTATSDGAQLTERFERLGTSIDASAGWDAAMLRLTTLSSRLPAAFALLGEVMREPGFRERDVERLKTERLADLLQLRTEPRGLADEMFDHLLYEPGSRYAQPAGGSEQSVTALTRDELARFYAERWVPGAVTLVVAGDVSADQAEALAAATFGDWTGAVPARVPASDRPARTSRAVHIVTKEDAPQSELRVGHVGVPRTHPDFFPVTVMNAVLGGLFSSRINLNLREAHAYTYGASSEFEYRRQAGPFVVSTAVKTDVTEPAAREILAEIDRIRAAPIADDELSLATSYLAGVFPIRYETTNAIATALASLVVYGLPEDYFDTYRDRIRGVTVADVHAAARTHLRTDALQIVVVGDPAAIREPLARLEAGPVTVYDAEGKVV